jgi:hypothetical protein
MIQTLPDSADLRCTVQRFVRSTRLMEVCQTPCGQSFSVAQAHALMFLLDLTPRPQRRERSRLISIWTKSQCNDFCRRWTHRGAFCSRSLYLAIALGTSSSLNQGGRRRP